MVAPPLLARAGGGGGWMAKRGFHKWLCQKSYWEAIFGAYNPVGGPLGADRSTSRADRDSGGGRRSAIRSRRWRGITTDSVEVGLWIPQGGERWEGDGLLAPLHASSYHRPRAGTMSVQAALTHQ